MATSGGDPESRRVFRRRAGFLAKAGRAATALGRALDRAASPLAADARELAERIAREERAARHRADGRVEGRRRYKRSSGSGNPVRDDRPINVLCVDESGVPYLQDTPGGGDWFALGGVAMTQEEAARYRDAADRLKLEFFGRVDLTFHEPLMRRYRQDFGFDGDERRRRAFDGAIRDLVAESRFTAFAVGIRKRTLRDELGGSDSDPYLPPGIYSIAIHLLLELYVDFLAHEPSEPVGRVVWEAQGPREDAEHQRDFVDTLLGGTRRTSESAFRRFLEPGVSFVPKGGSHPIELSDMLARDVFEWIRSDCLAEPPRWTTLGDKFYRRGNAASGEFGLTVFPDIGVRNRVEACRERMGAGH